MLRLILILGCALAGCGQRFTADTYATRSVQQADKVEQGVVVGIRPVRITADGTIGAATGAAAGGVVGSAFPGTNLATALGGVGGALVGGVAGRAVEQAIVDADAFEYIVRTLKGDLLRVTQQDKPPLMVGLPVLVITGAQARVVADYTVPNVPSANVAMPIGGAPAAPAAASAASQASTLPPVVAGAIAASAGSVVSPEARAVGEALAPIAAPDAPAYPNVPPAPPKP